MSGFCGVGAAVFFLVSTGCRAAGMGASLIEGANFPRAAASEAGGFLALGEPMKGIFLIAAPPGPM